VVCVSPLPLSEATGPIEPLSHAGAATNASAATCAHCGKEGAPGVVFKRCSGCKHATYCGAECQNAAWKGHKKEKECEPLEVVRVKVKAAFGASDWQRVLKWEGRMEELIEGAPDHVCVISLERFSIAHMEKHQQTLQDHHAHKAVRLRERGIGYLVRLERFRDAGETMCDMAETLGALRQLEEAASHFQRARDIGVQHGFFVVECKACKGLGQIACREGRVKEGVELLQNALAAASLSEHDESSPDWGILELDVLRALTQKLFEAKAIDEVEPLVLRYRELAKVRAREGKGRFMANLASLFASARLHKVLCVS